MVFPEILGEDFVDEVVGIVLVHLDFFEDDAALAADVAGVENRVQHQVAENVHSDGQMLVQNLNVEADTFLGGEGVHVAADGVHLARNVFRAERCFVPLNTMCSMKCEMPFHSQVFVARAGLDPDPDRDGANVLHLLGDQGSVRWAGPRDECCVLPEPYKYCCTT